MKTLSEIMLRLSNERALRTGEPCTCEYVTLLKSFRKETLQRNIGNKHWNIAQNF